MKKLRDYILEAEEKKMALGHFNISNIEGLWGIFNAAKKLDLPIIIGVSEGERKFIGVQQVAALVKSIREEFNYPIFLNADHTYTFEGVKEVVDAGFDSVIFDGAKLPLEENIEITEKCVEYAKDVNPDILVEGELGYIGSSSKVLEDIPEGANTTKDLMTTPQEAKRFVEETDVDLLSPAVGNLHGMLKGRSNPELDIERVREIREACGVPLVLHGGSGITDEDFVEAIKAGISTVHINTEIRLAFKEAAEKSLRDNPDQIAPYKVMKPAVEAIEEVVERRLRLFSGK